MLSGYSTVGAGYSYLYPDLLTLPPLRTRGLQVARGRGLPFSFLLLFLLLRKDDFDFLPPLLASDSHRRFRS